jgi:hypothetical protein
MFLVNDTQSVRHARIRQFAGREITIGALLAAIDFEWTIRRVILACGVSPTRHIRQVVLDKCHGLDAYKSAWTGEVFPRHGVRLPSLLDGWQFLKNEAMPLRHKLTHGVQGTTGSSYAIPRREALLDAAVALAEFSKSKGADVYARLPIRRKSLDP